jgi:hypothetical protein
MIAKGSKTLEMLSNVFTTWELMMLIIGIGCFLLLLFLSVIVYNYIHRFDLDDALQR